jgi:hypothetical protein
MYAAGIGEGKMEILGKMPLNKFKRPAIVAGVSHRGNVGENRAKRVSKVDVGSGREGHAIISRALGTPISFKIGQNNALDTVTIIP